MWDPATTPALVQHRASASYNPRAEPTKNTYNIWVSSIERYLITTPLNQYFPVFPSKQCVAHGCTPKERAPTNLKTSDVLLLLLLLFAAAAAAMPAGSAHVRSPSILVQVLHGLHAITWIGTTTASEAFGDYPALPLHFLIGASSEGPHCGTISCIALRPVRPSATWLSQALRKIWICDQAELSLERRASQLEACSIASILPDFRQCLYHLIML